MSIFIRSLLLTSFLLVACASEPKSKYPASWWEEVDREAAASWEILPQEAKEGEVILSKRNELGILSNFAATPFRFGGKSYASLEGFWQSLKYPESGADERAELAEWPYARQQVEQMVGFKAKKAGDFASRIMKKNNIDWVTYKGKRLIYRQKGNSPFYKLIKKVTKAKIEQNPEVKKILMSTGDLKLKPDHKQRVSDPKAWRYYKIYMRWRAYYKKKENKKNKKSE